MNKATAKMPASLEGIFPASRWDQSKLWALPTPVSTVATEKLWWLLDLPVWASDPPEAIFDLAPSS